MIPLAKYNKAMYTQVSLGMRFRMMFETEESGVRRYMGTITGISDLDPVRWKNSQWRNLQVFIGHNDIHEFKYLAFIVILENVWHDLSGKHIINMQIIRYI